LPIQKIALIPQFRNMTAADCFLTSGGDCPGLNAGACGSCSPLKSSLTSLGFSRRFEGFFRPQSTLFSIAQNSIDGIMALAAPHPAQERIAAILAKTGAGRSHRL